MGKYLACTANSVEVAGAPDVITLLPLGHVKSRKGDFEVDAESFRAMKRQLEDRGIDLVIDYEHQTLAGTQAPAAGWVKELLLKEDGIAARVEWTPAARKYLENREYRYISPVVSVRKSDSKATALYSAGLTNTPAIDGMTPIVNSLNFEGGQSNMDLLEELAELLGLGGDATEEQVSEAVGKALADAKALKEQAGAVSQVVANKAVCEALGLKEGAGEADITARIVSLKSGSEGAASTAEEVKALKAKLAEQEAEAAVSLALKAGKITPAQHDWAKGYALASPDGFAQFVEKAPQVVPMGELLGTTKVLKDTPLDEATLLVCKQMGVSEEDIKKFGKEG